MTIVERSKIIAAYQRVVRELGSDPSAACAAVAQSFGLSVELVEAVLGEQEVEVQS